MPYFITDKHPDCPGWAVVKQDGSLLGCQGTKEEAIDQMVALSYGENLRPGGEYEGDDFPVSRALPENYRPALAEDVPEGRACGNCIFYQEDMVSEDGTRAWCSKWEEYVEGDHYCNAWQGEEERQDDPASTPAPPEDQIEGSEENEPGSASGAGGDIKLSDSTQTALRNKVSEHNEAMEEEGKPDWTRTTYGQLAAVYRRGAGAYSTSHRPGISRAAWAMARVNAYLYLLRNGKPKSASYVTDNDLLPEDHPKSTRSNDVGEKRQVNLDPPAYMRAAARQGLKYYEEGLAGDGLVDATVREARAMARGNVTAEKWVRIAAWISRHLGDLDAEAADPDHENYPSPGVVAHLLWGSGPSKRAAERALAYARGVVDRLEAENADRASGRAVAKLETRMNPTDFEIRETSEGMTFEGYAALFDSPSEPLPFTERIAPGAFTRSLKSRNDIKMLWNHSTSEVLGSTRAGTMKLYEDDRGLKVWAMLPNTTTGRDAAELIRRGDVDSMSFGFSVPSGGDSWSADGSERTLQEVRLHEVSVVAFPAYAETAGTTTVRGLDRLAERAEVDSDALADALLKVEMGDDISTDDKALLERVLAKLAPEEDEQDQTDLAMLQLKKKKLEILMGL